MKNRIELDFGDFVLEAELFDTKISKKFADHLPYQVTFLVAAGEQIGTLSMGSDGKCKSK